MTIFNGLPEDEQRSILHIKAHVKNQSEDKGKALPSVLDTNQASGSSQAENLPQSGEVIATVSLSFF